MFDESASGHGRTVIFYYYLCYCILLWTSELSLDDYYVIVGGFVWLGLGMDEEWMAFWLIVVK